MPATRRCEEAFKLDGQIGESPIDLARPRRLADDSTQSGNQGVEGSGSGEDESKHLSAGTTPVEVVCPMTTTAHFSGLELAGSIDGKPVNAFIDSGSTSNYISSDLARSLDLMAHGNLKTLQLADGSERKTLGTIRKLSFRCGKVVMTFDVDVFDGLSHAMILGFPWLIAENPRIDYQHGIVTVHRRGGEIDLPVRHQPHHDDQLRSAHDQIVPVTIGPHHQRSHTPPDDHDHQQHDRLVGPRLEVITEKQIIKDLKRNPDLDALMVVVQPVEEGKTAVETIPIESEGDDLDKLLRGDLDERLVNVLQGQRHVFAKDLPVGVPPKRKGHEFRIELEEGAEPIYRPLYKLSPMELEEVKNQIDYLLEKQFIRPSESPFGAPILFVPKKDGGLRMCLDYRWLNRITIKNRYPLPLPEEMIDRLFAAKVFSKIDLRSGYWQMPIREADVHKTAFRSRFGHFECRVLPFGVCNAPAQFMAMMNDIFHDMLDRHVIIFLDDILIFSQSMEDHVRHLDAVLQRLSDHKLFAKASKCEIAQKTTEFVGHKVTPEGISPMDAKVKAINDWRELDSVSDVRSFLGMASFYRKFVPQFAKICGPLHELTKKGVR